MSDPYDPPYPELDMPSGDALRVPPHSLQAEQSLLGGLMLDNQTWDSVADKVNDGDFYRREHRLIFAAIRDLAARDQPFDVVTLAEWLERTGQLDDAGGLPYLGVIATGTPSAANVKAYAKIVRERSVLRQLISVGTGISDIAFNTEGREVAELLDEAERRVFEIAEQEQRGGGGFQPLRSLLGKAVERIEILFQRNEPITGLPTGFADFDEMTSGLQPSDLIIVAGRPSMGKCLQADSEILLEDGSLERIETLVQRRQARLLSLHADWRLRFTSPTAYVDDGHKPVFRVTTRLGRVIETTASHPYLTPAGWRPLTELTVGQAIAVPRALPVFGREALPECRVKLLAYLLGDGSLTRASPQFTNVNPRLQEDFMAAVAAFGGLKASLVSRPDRATCIRVAADTSWIRRHRQLFAERLRQALATATVSQRQLALAIGASPASVCGWLQGTGMPGEQFFERIREFFATPGEAWLPEDRLTAAKNAPNALSRWLEELGLAGKDAHAKTIPDCVLRLPRPQLALFINRLFATDGWATRLASGQSQLGYASVSEPLVRRLQHLLLRFGTIAKLKRRSVRLEGKTFGAWQLDITDAQSIRTFVDEIGIFGKEEALARVQEALDSRRYQTNRDLIPIEFWERISARKGDETWRHLAERAGLAGSSNIHVGRRALSRARLAKLARALDDQGLLDLAHGQVYWDEIQSIEYLGEQQVYDLTIPETHNFVANDICVHNTSFAMNMAENVALAVKRPVAIFSMEMPGDALAMRMMSSLGRIDQHRVRTGKLEEDEWPRLTSAVNMLADAPMYIDDTPALSPTEVRARARRLKREHGDLALIVLDYLQLMQVPGNSENRATEISAISRALKALAKELKVPVVALSQLNRSLEQRPNKRPVMSDLRESGAIEQDADLIVFIYRDEVYHEDSKDKGVAEIIIGKQRNGPIGTTRLTFLGKYTKFENYISDVYGDEGYH